MGVFYTAAGTAPEEARAAIRRAEEAARPALLVLDDADDAGPDLLDRSASPRRTVARAVLLVLTPNARKPSGSALTRARPAP